MNLPNKITLFRVVVIIPAVLIVAAIKPLYDISLFDGLTNLAYLIILGLFIIGALTDFLDGYIARKRNLVTTFGKFVDPIADKLLVLAVMIILLLQENSILAFGKGFVVTLILAREFIVTGLRVIAANNNLVIAASKLGKIKTNFQFIMIILLLVTGLSTNTYLIAINYFILGLTCALTIISGADYLIKNKKIFLESI